MSWLLDHIAWIGWGTSELLTFIPSVKSNGVAQLVVKVVKQIVDAFDKASSADAPKS